MLKNVIKMLPRCPKMLPNAFKMNQDVQRTPQCFPNSPTLSRFPFLAKTGSCWRLVGLMLAPFGSILPHLAPILPILLPHCLQDAPKMPQDGPTCPKMTKITPKMDPSGGQKSLKINDSTVFLRLFRTLGFCQNDA